MLPTKMLGVPHWIFWKLEINSKGKPTKVPYSINGYRASSTDSTTWSEYLAIEDAKSIEYDGIGFMAGATPIGFILIDLDHCIVDGTTESWAEEIVELANTYTEISPSGDGIHCFLGGKLGNTSKKTDHAEIYDHARYFTITENIYKDRNNFREVTQEEINKIYALVKATGPEQEETALNDKPQGTCQDDDDAVVIKMFDGRYGEEAKKLFDGDMTVLRGNKTHSEADFALCKHLAYWTDRDSSVMDRIFRRSKLMRDKWDSTRGDKTYGWMTINQAIAHCKKTHQNSIAETDINFWYIKGEGNKAKLCVDFANLHGFLNQKGFRKYYSFENLESIYIKIESRLIEIVSKGQILDFVLKHIELLPDVLPGAEPFTRKNLAILFLSNPNYFLGMDKLQCMVPAAINFMRDTKDCSYIFYADKFAKITKDTVIFRPYSELDGYIWKKQKLERNCPADDCQDGEFLTFCRDIINKNDAIFLNLRTLLGYLLHCYKNPAHCFAIVLLDSKHSDDPEGRSGKSLLLESVGKIRNAVFCGGKDFRHEDKFVYQRVTEETALFVLDDVKKTFDFENIFSQITGGFEVEPKGKAKFIIPFDCSPKIAITSNYVINGAGGSFEARIRAFALNSIYDKENTPEKKFGHLFFGQWDKVEWEKFDSFMIYCLQDYLKYGILVTEDRGLNERKIYQKTSEEFVNFCNSKFDNYLPPVSEEGWELKKDYYNEYINLMGTDMCGTENKKLNLSWFGRWLAIYFKHVGKGTYEAKQRKIGDKQESCFKYTPEKRIEI
jgi:hypothetical protein